MKFEFQFQSLLNIRIYEEKKEQQELARLLAKEAELANQVSACKEKLNVLGQAVSGSGKQKASDVRQRYELKQDLQRKIWRLQQEQSRLKEDVDQQRGQLIEANKRTQILEKLESRERTKFIEHYQHLEQKQQNEIAMQIYNRAK